MADIVGNLFVAQSGGPTAVINASIAGVIQEAGRHPEFIDEIYGALNGILGILNEELIDIQDEKSSTLEGLKHTPGAALGTCRYKIDYKRKPEQAARDFDRIFEVFKAHNIRFLPNEKFIEYAQPLIAGELHVLEEGGLPKFAALEKVRVEKKLPAR